jgi:hypothetical protein
MLVHADDLTNLKPHKHRAMAELPQSIAVIGKSRLATYCQGLILRRSW